MILHHFQAEILHWTLFSYTCVLSCYAHKFDCHPNHQLITRKEVADGLLIRVILYFWTFAYAVTLYSTILLLLAEEWYNQKMLTIVEILHVFLYAESLTCST